MAIFFLRWWHLSAGEHFCQNCRDGLAASRCSNASLLADFAHWLRQRPIRAQEAAQHFMAASKLPYWLCCARCSKWRQLPRRLEANCTQPGWMASFRCDLLCPKAKNCCELPEDEVSWRNLSPKKMLIRLATDQFFMSSHRNEAFLKYYSTNSIFFSAACAVSAGPRIPVHY